MNQILISQLESLLDKDQTNIKLFREDKISEDNLVQIQKDNFIFIKQFIKENGFPFINVSSEKAYRAAFLVIQHSGETAYLQETIDLFNNKTDKEIIKSDLAYLIDRVRILNKQLQLYGTQYRIEHKNVTFFDLEDESNIEKRRKEMNMESFEDYKKKVKEMIVNKD
ncbi:hypothetical protein EXS61_00585 [Candidatus Parcubacteria bacterium]|nr:hypothetical protein [Candidatus Parcubacteria bacterium]